MQDQSMNESILPINSLIMLYKKPIQKHKHLKRVRLKVIRYQLINPFFGLNRILYRWYLLLFLWLVASFSSVINHLWFLMILLLLKKKRWILLIWVHKDIIVDVNYPLIAGLEAGFLG